MCLTGQAEFEYQHSTQLIVFRTFRKIELIERICDIVTFNYWTCINIYYNTYFGMYNELVNKQ